MREQNGRRQGFYLFFDVFFFACDDQVRSQGVNSVYLDVLRSAYSSNSVVKAIWVYAKFCDAHRRDS